MTDVSSATGSSLTESVPDKVVLVGDVGVGKTSIFLRFKTGKFQDTTPSHNPRDGEYQKEWQVAGSNVSVSAIFPTRHAATLTVATAIAIKLQQNMTLNLHKLIMTTVRAYLHVYTCIYRYVTVGAGIIRLCI